MFRSLALIAAFAHFAIAQEPITPRAREIIDALEKILPEHERAADDLDEAVQPFVRSSDPKVANAADAALLQIRAIRSVRKIIAEHPNYVSFQFGPGHLPRWKLGGEHFLAAAKAGKDGYEGGVSGTRPFRTRIDDEVLLYKFSLPKEYDSTKKYPLRVELHSGGGFTWLAPWVTGKPSDSKTAGNSLGAVQIFPGGRQHVATGEVAVLEAIADACKHFAIDPDRIYIGGASWGGTGGFHFGTLLPDRFAAAHSLTGGGNYAVPVGNGRFDAYMLGDNLCNLPFVVWDTPGDGHFKANHAFCEGLRERAKKYPGSYPHLELTDPKGGHGIIDRGLQQQGWDWMMKQTRDRRPTRVIYESHSLRYDGAYWARIDTVIDSNKPARIEAEIESRGVCRVAIENADRFHLDLATAPTGELPMLELRISDAPSIKVPTKTVYLRKTESGWSTSLDRHPAGLIKKHGLSGPLQDAFLDHPVLFVHRKGAEAAVGEIVRRLFGKTDGTGFLHSGFPRRLDDRVTDKDIAEKNLILIGTPKQNAFLDRILEKLPVAFQDDGLRIAGKTHRGVGVSLAMIYPNPLNPERYVLLLGENYPAGKLWDYPDYVVLQSPKEGNGNPAILAKGSFDSRWQAP